MGRVGNGGRALLLGAVVTAVLAVGTGVATAGVAARGVGATVAMTARGGGVASAEPGTSAGATSMTIPFPTRAAGSVSALIVAGAWARSRPGAGRRVAWVSTATAWSGEPKRLLVLGSAEPRRREWIRVLLGIRPDGAAGWIPRDGVVLRHQSLWVVVDKTRRRVSIYRRERLLRSFRAVIGKPATPTPDGLAAIYEHDRQADPTGFLGPWALPLTIFSHVLTNFGGGPGRIAIHGRDGLSLLDPLGSRASHGCIRVDNDEIDWMAAHTPNGTPVQITG